ncbi:RlpA-like double-psi beta-barrel domain-containing protein [Streptomyces sp. GQFP]|uniref:RlpA-like double-psi beta-barrel domain-containing protein n=1 Tax=Streptomyces sp. GQFP TaxID=2907545 RepID=UPI001F457306|nr:RlpA-like double-psi beta-barrel domain-containing protein [Streptomyces sp. GQFP]UIX34815.1 RlpA-like double-psi beta-barrel domain-containing protein [Streptomyces sp. GQFP]
MSRIMESLKAMKSATRRSLTVGAVTAGVAVTTALGASPASAETWHYGSVTWYNPSAGVGACGQWHGDNELVAAVSPQMYGSYPNPNNSPVCGKYVIVYGPTGKATWAKIVDRCAQCAAYDVDLSPAAFGVIADLGVGRFSTYWADYI